MRRRNQFRYNQAIEKLDFNHHLLHVLTDEEYHQQYDEKYQEINDHIEQLMSLKSWRNTRKVIKYIEKMCEYQSIELQAQLNKQLRIKQPDNTPKPLMDVKDAIELS